MKICGGQWVPENPQLVKHYDHTIAIQRAAANNENKLPRKGLDLDLLAKILTPEQVAELTRRWRNESKTAQPLARDAPKIH